MDINNNQWLKCTRVSNDAFVFIHCPLAGHKKKKKIWQRQNTEEQDTNKVFLLFQIQDESKHHF